MTARKKSGTKPHSVVTEDRVSADRLLSSLRQNEKLCDSADAALDSSLLAISLVEVVARSLEAQEIASPEREVLQIALKEQWAVHDWLSDATPVIVPQRADGGAS